MRVERLEISEYFSQQREEERERKRRVEIYARWVAMQGPGGHIGDDFAAVLAGTAEIPPPLSNHDQRMHAQGTGARCKPELCIRCEKKRQSAHRPDGLCSTCRETIHRQARLKRKG